MFVIVFMMLCFVCVSWLDVSWLDSVLFCVVLCWSCIGFVLGGCGFVSFCVLMYVM